MKTDAKSNEITVILQLFYLLDIRGYIVIIDLMVSQTKIVDKSGYYLLPVKCNQKKLQSSLDNIFSIQRLKDEETDNYPTSEKAHCREEICYCMVTVSCEIGDLGSEWPALRTQSYVFSIRIEKGKETTAIVKFYISSAELDVKAPLNASIGHWSI